METNLYTIYLSDGETVTFKNVDVIFNTATITVWTSNNFAIFYPYDKVVKVELKRE
jgi:hypothetical protein